MDKGDKVIAPGAREGASEKTLRWSRSRDGAFYRATVRVKGQPPLELHVTDLGVSGQIDWGVIRLTDFKLLGGGEVPVRDGNRKAAVDSAKAKAARLVETMHTGAREGAEVAAVSIAPGAHEEGARETTVTERSASDAAKMSGDQRAAIDSGLARYGASLNDDGYIVHGSKALSVRAEVQKGRLRLVAPAGNLLASYPVSKAAAGVSDFVEKFWYWKPEVAAKESAAGPKLPDCEPCLRVEKDIDKFAICAALADRIGPLKTAKQIDALVGPYLRRQDQEVFVILVTDIRFKYRGHSEIARGQRSRVGVGVDDVVSIVTKVQGERVFIVHNHPSGDPSPSRPDKELTDTLRKALSGKGFEDVVIVDHVIIGSATSFSLEENKSFKA